MKKIPSLSLFISSIVLLSSVNVQAAQPILELQKNINLTAVIPINPEQRSFVNITPIGATNKIIYYNDQFNKFDDIYFRFRLSTSQKKQIKLEALNNFKMVCVSDTQTEVPYKMSINSNILDNNKTSVTFDSSNWKTILSGDSYQDFVIYVTNMSVSKGDKTKYCYGNQVLMASYNL